MEVISTSEVLEWSAAFIGDTIQKKRRVFQEQVKCPLKSGTENGNILLEELLEMVG